MVERSFYSDRADGPRPRTLESVTRSAWRGLVTLTWQRIADGSLAQEFPQRGCRDEPSQITGTHDPLFYNQLDALVPQLRRQTDLPGPAGPALLDPDQPPQTSTALDIVDFVAQRIAAPVRTSATFHKFYGHYHLAFDPDAGQQRFRTDIDEIFARNGIAFTLGDDLQVRRLGHPKPVPC